MSLSSWSSLVPRCFLLCVTGCAAWTVPPASPKQLPSPPMSPDCVVLEVAFLRLPEDPVLEEELWTQVDEQMDSIDMRRHLTDNGLRAGRIGTQLPEALQQTLDAARTPLEAITQGEAPEENELFAFQQRLQLRAGKDRKVRATRTTLEELVLLLAEEGMVRAVRLERPLGFFNIRSHPLGDGRVQLALTPEVEFGAARQRHVGGQGLFLRVIDRPRHVLEHLRIETVLAPGQTLLVSATPEARGLGAHFFAPHVSGREERSAMLVRLAQTQIDDLFSPEEVLSSLALPPTRTPTED